MNLFYGDLMDKFIYFMKQLRARPEYREPRPHFEAKELIQQQPIRRPQPQIEYHAKPRPHHDNEVKKLFLSFNFIKIRKNINVLF